MDQASPYLQFAEHYAQQFATMTQDNYALRIKELFSSNAYFKDPFNEVQGRDKITAIFRHMYQNLSQPSFESLNVCAQNNRAYIEWRFEFSMTEKQPKQHFVGLSRVEFNAQGQCQSHIDYWDSGPVVYQKIPFMGWFNRWVAKKLALSSQPTRGDAS